MPELVALTDPRAVLDVAERAGSVGEEPRPEQKRSGRNAFFGPLESLALLVVEAVTVLLLARVALGAAGLSAHSPFVRWLSVLSSPLVAPFQGALPELLLFESYHVESDALLALGGYLLLWLLLQRFLARLAGGPRPQ
jgi:hypothetical protein